MGPIAYHQCVAVYKRDRKASTGFNIFRTPDIVAPQIDQKIKIEGIYFFGGKGLNGFP